MFSQPFVKSLLSTLLEFATGDAAQEALDYDYDTSSDESEAGAEEVLTKSGTTDTCDCNNKGRTVGWRQPHAEKARSHVSHLRRKRSSSTAGLEFEMDKSSPFPNSQSPIATVCKMPRGDSPVAHQRRPIRSAADLLSSGSSESGLENDCNDARSVRSLSVARTHNGHWIPKPTTGNCGLDPISRGNDLVSSPNDLKGQREREQKDDAITIWAESVSVANSETDDEPPFPHESLRYPGQKVPTPP